MLSLGHHTHVLWGRQSNLRCLVHSVLLIKKVACRVGIKLENSMECWKTESKLTSIFQSIQQRHADLCFLKGWWYLGPTTFYYSDPQILLPHSLWSSHLELFATDQIFIGFSFLESWAMLFPPPRLSFLSNFKHSNLYIPQDQPERHLFYKTRPATKPKSPFLLLEQS